MQELLLINRAKTGDKDALAELFRLHYPLLKGFLLKATLDESLAEDLAQETVLKAIVHLPDYRPLAKFSTWLISIGLNLYRNQLRRRGRILPLADVPEPAADGSVEEQAEEDMRRESLRDLLRCLPPEKREVFLLRYEREMQYEEIAAVLKCPIGTVRSRLHDAVAILRREAERRGLA